MAMFTPCVFMVFMNLALFEETLQFGYAYQACLLVTSNAIRE